MCSMGTRGPALTLLLGALLLAGCAGYFAARRGADAMKHGDYRAAVTEYARAVEENPDKKEYADALGRARAALAEQLLGEGERALAAGRLGAAYQALSEAVRQRPEHARARARLKVAAAAFSAQLEKEGEAFEAQGRHAAAVERLRRGAEVAAVAGRDPAQPEAPDRPAALRGRADAILTALGGRLAEGGQDALRRGLRGLGWARLRVATLINGGDAGALPDLEPTLRYRVQIRVGGDGATGGAAGFALQELIRPLGARRVVLLDRGDRETPELALRLSAAAPQLETSPPRVVQKTERYVQRIDMVPNPRYHQLRRELRRLGEQQGQIEGEIAGTDEQIGLARAAAERAERRHARAREAAQRDAEIQLRDIEGRAQDLSQRIRRLREELSELESRESQLSYQQNRTPQAEEERSRLREKIERTRERIRAADRERDALEDQGRRLRSGELSSPLLEAAREALGQARAALEALGTRRDRALEALRQTSSAREDRERELSQTPPTVPEKVYADYPYTEAYFRRSASTTALLEASTPSGALPPLPIEASASAEDFARDEHRARGEPDLYIAAHEVRFPPDEELVAELTRRIGAKAFAALRARLLGHCDRFVQAGAGLSGDERLDKQVYVYHCREQLSREADGAEAMAALRRELGLILPEERVDLERLDGR